MSGLKKITLDQASHEEMLAFAEAHGLDVPAAAHKQTAKGEDDLRDLLKLAGHEAGILVIAQPMILDTGGIEREAAHDYDPERERWSHFMLNPQVTGTEHERQPPAFVSVNDESIYIPWSHQIVAREIFYLHFRGAKERHWKQKTDDSGKMIKGRVSFWVDRYPMSFYGYVGYVADGVPPIVETRKEEILFIPPGGSEAGAWAAAREAETRRRMAA